MDYDFIEMNEEEIEYIENQLEEYDEQHISYKLNGTISMGAKMGERLIAGVDGCFTAFHIFYVSTVFVDEEYRHKGIGKALLEKVEEKAVQLGAKLIRLDTFDWQGRDFYNALGYEEVGSYTDEEDGFSEYFFLKRV